MRFKVLKSCLDGISGGECIYDTVDDVLRQVFFHRGWESLEQMHSSIRKWASVASPGDVFCTQVTAIVAIYTIDQDRDDDVCHHCNHAGLDYDELEPSADGISQNVSCPGCGKRWVDIFTLTGRRELER